MVDSRYEPGSLPPDTPINSKGMPYYPETPQESANVKQSMQALRTQGFGPSTTGSEPPATREVQSEPTPPPRPPLNPVPYAWFQKNDPTIAGWIDNAAQATGASPERLAVHKWLESGKHQVSGRGRDGEIGVMQIMPSTWRRLDPKGEFDPDNGQQAMMLAGTLINRLDADYGKDTPLSVARYNGSGPRAAAYARRALPGAIPDSAFDEDPSRVTKHDLIMAAHQGGPDAVLKYMVEATPRNFTMDDRWRNVEATLVQASLAKGDVAGAQAARDFVTSLAHTGTNQHLMAAHQALQAGQGTTAAQHLAAAHAFFPDGTMGRFYSDGQGVYAERVDENNPSISHGKSPITPDAIAGLLNQTSSPEGYLKMVMEQQKASAQNRLAQTHGDYYTQLPGIKAAQMANQSAIAAAHDSTHIAAAGMRAQGQRDVAEYNAGVKGVLADQAEAGKNYRAGMRTNGQQDFNKEVSGVYDPRDHPNDPNVGRKAQIMSTLRSNGLVGPMAQQATELLASGNYQAQVRMTPDGPQAGVFAKDASGKIAAQPMVLLPPAVLQQLASPTAARPRQMAPPPPMVGGALGAATARPNPFAGARPAPGYVGGGTPAYASRDDEEDDE